MPVILKIYAAIAQVFLQRGSHLSTLRTCFLFPTLVRPECRVTLRILSYSVLRQDMHDLILQNNAFMFVSLLPDKVP
jgi:hypothetical protein